MTEAKPGGILLCGIKHCGKSTIGALLGCRLGLPFIDLDRETEAVHRRETGQALTVREMYRLLGGEGFMRYEAQAVRELAASGQAAVVALGGGTPMNPGVRPEWLRGLGRVVLLDISPALAYRRVQAGGLPPFLASSADPEAEFLRLCRDRLAVYRRLAEVIHRIEAEGTPEQEADRVMAALGSCPAPGAGGDRAGASNPP